MLALSIVAAAALSPAASAQQLYDPDAPAVAAPVATGAVAGTVVGVGVSEAWFGSTVAGASLTGGAAAAATAGGVAGIAAIALIHSVTTPCHGFLIGLDVFNPGPSACAQPLPPPRRVVRRR
jgi:hypothetical protein